MNSKISENIIKYGAIYLYILYLFFSLNAIFKYVNALEYGTPNDFFYIMGGFPYLIFVTILWFNVKLLTKKDFVVFAIVIGILCVIGVFCFAYSINALRVINIINWFIPIVFLLISLNRKYILSREMRK